MRKEVATIQIYANNFALAVHNQSSNNFEKIFVLKRQSKCNTASFRLHQIKCAYVCVCAVIKILKTFIIEVICTKLTHAKILSLNLLQRF